MKEADMTTFEIQS